MYRPLGIIGLTIFAAAACTRETGLQELSAEFCEAASTTISEIQGRGPASPLVSTAATTLGVVNHVGDDGFYMQSIAGDGDPATSEGLFVALSPEGIAVGDLLALTGVVTELGGGRNTVTSLSDITAWRRCASNFAIDRTPFSLPLTGPQRESLEGMGIEIASQLTVTGNYRQASGELLLSGDGILFQPTEVARPGPDARQQDAENQRNSIAARWPPKRALPTGTDLLSGGGVVGHDGRALTLLLDEQANLMDPRLYRISPPGARQLRVVSLNLHNYFNGDGVGGGFPTARGAETAQEFKNQRQRLSATIRELEPHLVAAMELENDGFDQNSAASDFSRDLQAATDRPWQPVIPQGLDRIGNDQIAVGLFFDPQVLAPVGEARILEGPAFDDHSRSPLAQTFIEQASGERFLVVVNHLKSKGSCPDDGRNSDLRDGQGCWNQARVEAAEAMVSWARQLADATADQRLLVLGDLNAYRMEDPITALIEAGLKDLTAPSGPRPSFSFVYGGEAGTLDYAMASYTLVPFIASARVLNINSPWPPGMSLPRDWLRSSDHDPVVVDLRFSRD
ncbi:MAG: ExeM/NucH family extracellular endonuclease [Xanthomonadales bacterium]|nr:ExeM/NucH family extracellular endonuclease [Xanthomonadales bacterium]